MGWIWIIAWDFQFKVSILQNWLFEICVCFGAYIILDLEMKNNGIFLLNESYIKQCEDISFILFACSSSWEFKDLFNCSFCKDFNLITFLSSKF